MKEGKQSKKEEPTVTHKTRYDEYLESRKKLVPELVIRAKGEDRSMNAYAKDAGVSRAALSQIVNGVYVPSPEVISKLTSDAACPRNGVTFEEFMATAGYNFRNRLEEDSYDIFAELENGKKIVPEAKTKDASQKMPNQCNDSFEERRKARLQFEQEATSAICISLFNKGVMFQRATESASNTIRNDLVIDISNQKIIKWTFDFGWVPEERKIPIMSMFRSRLFENAALINLDEKAKYTFVVNNEKAYQYLKRYEKAVGIRGEVSVAYFSSAEKKIVDEFYLANYKLGDQTKEIYLIKTTEE